MTTPARLLARMTSSSTSTTMTAMPAIPMPATARYRRRGSGLETMRDEAGRFLRPNEYWVRPMPMPTAAAPKPTVEPVVGLQEAGDERPEERADVDAEVEDREPGVSSRILRGVQRPDDGGRVRLQTAGADGDEDEADPEAPHARQHGEHDVAEHDDDRAVEEHALRPEQPIGDPRPEDRREIDGAAVRADDPRRDGLVHPEAALGDRVVHVEEQDALHAVEAEPLPQLHAEDGREGSRLPEEAGVLVSAALRIDGRRGASVRRGVGRADGDLFWVATLVAHGVRLVGSVARATVPHAGITRAGTDAAPAVRHAAG